MGQFQSSFCMHETCHINIRKKAFSCYKCGTGAINILKRGALREQSFLGTLRDTCQISPCYYCVDQQRMRNLSLRVIGFVSLILIGTRIWVEVWTNQNWRRKICFTIHKTNHMFRQRNNRNNKQNFKKWKGLMSNT